MSTDPFSTEPQSTTQFAAEPSTQTTIGPQFYGQAPATQPTSWNQPQFRAPSVNLVPTPTVSPMTQPYPHAVEHPQNIPGLVCGIVGLCGAFPVGIVALVMGLRATHDIQRYPTRYTGRGMALANIILGAIGTAATVMIALFLMFVFVDLMIY